MDLAPFTTDLILQQVCNKASSKAVEGSPCSVCRFLLRTRDRPIQGGQCDVFALEDHTGRHACIRIYRDPGPTSAYLLEQEVQYRKKIQYLEIDYFQRMLCYFGHNSAVIQTPFISLEWAPGKPLSWTDKTPARLSDREKIKAAIAHATMDLLKIQDTEIISAKEYMSSKIARKLCRAIMNQYPGGDAQSCTVQRDLLERYWKPELDGCPRVLVHGDLSPNNIIVDDDNNVQSIIDLSWAEMVPLQFAAAYPRFLTHEFVKRKCKLTDKTEFDWPVKMSDVLQRDRLLYLECVRERALLGDVLLNHYYNLLSLPEEMARYWWIKSISESSAHQAMVACNWMQDDFPTSLCTSDSSWR